MAAGTRRGPGIKARNISPSAGIEPYKLDLRYATVTAFLAAKAGDGYNSSSAQEGDWFYNTTAHCIYRYNGSNWGPAGEIGATKFFRTNFNSLQVANGPAGAAVSGTANAINSWSVNGLSFEASPRGTQTILAPVMGTTGYIDLGSQDQTAGDGIELTRGVTAGTPNAFVIGTDAAFYTKATFISADVSGCAPLVVGFRGAQAYASNDGGTPNLPNYNDFACIGLVGVANPATLKIVTDVNNGGPTTTDTTQTVADTVAVTLTVLVSAAGVVTYKINESAPAATAAFTFDNGDTVVPFINFTQGADIAGQTSCTLWECGYQTGAE